MRVYDLEIFAHDMLLGVYDGKEYVQIWNDNDKMREYYEKYQDDVWCGHNSSSYDSILFKIMLLGKSPEEVKHYSDRIISGREDKKIIRELKLNRIKLYDWDILNDKVLYSLKEAEGFLGLKIYETEVDFNLQRPLTEEEKRETEEYNRHDLYSTWQEMKEQIPSIKIRMALIQEYNLPKSMISATNQKITGEILEGQYTDFKDKQAPYDPSIAPIVLNNPEYHKALEMFTDCDQIDYKKKLKINIAGIEHTIAIGGLHGARSHYQYHGEIWDVDVGSYYPNMMINFNLCSRAMKNPENFPKIVKKRLAIKKKVNEAYANGTDDQLTAVEKAMPFGLKLVVNTVSGAMKAKFSKLYDERNNNWMCITGQLLLIDLIEKLEPYMTLIQSNTDGIFIIPHDKEACDREIQKWMDKTGLILEKTVGTDLYQKDVNNYVFVNEGGITCRGAYIAQYYNENGLFQCRRNNDIIDEGIVNYLVYNKDPHETVNRPELKLWRFQIVKKIGGMYKACAYEVDGQIIPTPNRCNRVFAAKNHEKYGKVKKMKNGKDTWDNVESLPEHCIIINDDIRGVTVADRIDDIDLDWYENEIKRKVVDFVLDSSQRTKGKKYSLEQDWEMVQKVLGRE